MKILFTLSFLLLLTGGLYAQVPGRPPAVTKPALPLREVSGIVKDSTDEVVIGATIKLKTAKDSVTTTTNADGIFVFKNVTSASFLISITNIGYRPLVKRMLNNDAVPRLVLDPFVLNAESKLLDAVTVKAPSITYKTDTVEYRASDYKVRPNATVDEVLKKMEGMEVGTDGSVTHQGQSVTKVKLNGKTYAGGNVAQAIQNLPADIIDKIQVVDDYGDQAARTGIKDGDPEKVLNITTRADRSVGNLIRVNAGAGNDERFEGRAYLQRINGNQQISFIGDLRNTVNGVASSGANGGSAGGQIGGGGNQGGNNGLSNSSGGSGGTTNTGTPTLSYSDQWGKKIQVAGSYRYNFTNVNSLNNSDGSQFFNTLPQNRADSTVNFRSSSQAENKRRSHQFDFKMEYQIDSANYLQITPTVNVANTNSFSESSRFDTGLRHQDRMGLNSSINKAPTFGGLVLYQHMFKKPRRNISLQVNMTNSKVEQDNEQNIALKYYNDLRGTSNDSLFHRLIERDNLTSNLRGSLTYVEPLNLVSQIEFNAQYNRRAYDNSAFTSDIDSLGRLSPLTALSNVFNYAFTESRLALNYRLNKTKFNMSMGVTAVPTSLSGTNVSRGITTDRAFFNMIPIARFQYVWSRQERFTINYTGNPQEPSFNQIQPFRDVTNPQNPVVGNPDLRPSFRHLINAQYNNYIANSKLNLSANVNSTIVKGQITTNNVPITQTIIQPRPGGVGFDTTRTFINETRYVNLDGNYSISGNYNIQKQLADRKYNLSLNGSAGYFKTVSMLKGSQNLRTVWRLNERFGPRMNPNESIEVNPYIAYDITRTFFASNPSTNTDIRTTAIALEGKFYFLKNKTLEIGYNGSKNFVSGLPNNITRNPLVINAYIENDFFARRNLSVRLQVFDILKQNNFVNQVTTENSVTNTLTNALSRYFMFSVRANLQKWTGSPSRGGRALRRRGDGSFIEP